MFINNRKMSSASSTGYTNENRRANKTAHETAAAAAAAQSAAAGAGNKTICPFCEVRHEPAASGKTQRKKRRRKNRNRKSHRK